MYLCVTWGNIKQVRLLRLKWYGMVTWQNRKNTLPRIRKFRFLSPTLPFTLILTDFNSYRFSFLIHNMTKKFKTFWATASLLQIKLYVEVPSGVALGKSGLINSSTVPFSALDGH